MEYYDTDSAQIEDVLKGYLGPSELIKSILVARSMLSHEDGAPTPAFGQDAQILAVVSSSENVEEEGSVFIFKPDFTRRQSQSSPEPDYLLLATLPLTNALTISMAQSRARSGTTDLRPGKHVPTVRPSFLLTLDYAHQKWIFSTESSEALGAFVSDCRRFIKIANTSSHLDFRWLSKYQSHREFQVPTLFPRPDLRKIQRPAYSNLSSAAAGQPGDEDADIELIRDEWLRTKLDEDKNVFTGERSICIRLGTFNVNGKMPSQDLSLWIRPQHNKTFDQPSLPPLKTISPISLSSFTASDYLSVQPNNSSVSNDGVISDSNGDPDIYVLGFQELDLSTEALLYSYTTTREEMWLEAIFAALGEVRGQYTKLISRQLVGMLIICIVKNELVKDVTDVKACAVGTGIMGVMGNKGAVAVRLTLHSTVMTFANAHLAAFDEFTERRNSDFHDLSRRLLFSSDAENSTSLDASELNSESIFQSDVLFWMVIDYTLWCICNTLNFSYREVNLNYRIDLPDAEVRQLISGSIATRIYDVRDLLSHDQLTKVRLGGKAFEDFKEGEIRYLPSYRFSAGVGTDSSGYDIKRRPAWTDRILYQVAPHLRLNQTKYAAHPELTMSDHKPVSAEFRVSVREANESMYYKQVQQLFESLEDFGESEATPKLKLVSSELQFGHIRYKRNTTQQLVLQNTGKIPCAFRFVPLKENEPIFTPWLSAMPQMGIILPNEEFSISLTVHVDDASTPALNVGQDQLQHTLILHTERGKDHFIVVTGDYKRTCFANDLATLVRLPGPIRQLNIQKEPLAKESKVNAPREVIRLINWLMTNATDVPDLFFSHGDYQLIESIRESLDTGEEFNFDHTSQPQAEKGTLALSFADVLYQFFQSLPSPLIPSALQQRCTQVGDRDEAFEVISSELPGFALNVWISLTAFLHFIAQQKNYVDQEKPNECSKAAMLACIFAPVLLRDEPGTTAQVSPLAKRRFLMHFIQ